MPIAPRWQLTCLWLALAGVARAAPEGPSDEPIVAEPIAAEPPGGSPAAPALDEAAGQGGAPDRPPAAAPGTADVEEPPSAPGEMTLADVRKRLFAEGRTATFRRTTLLERAAVEALVPTLIDRARRGVDRTRDLTVMARLAGLSVETWRVHGQRYLALLEPPGDVRGAGAYIFRVGEKSRAVILQAPHAYFDLYTGRIAVGIFFGSRRGPRARALFVSTLHRYERGSRDRDSPADVCHHPEHLFSLATDRTLAALDGGLVIQLHGFDEAGAPPGTDAIISGGARETPSVALAAIAARVRARFGDGVRLFPTEVQRLGGTTNVQGRLAAARRAGFVHLEMARDLRVRLRKDPDLRHDLARALYGEPRGQGR